MSKPTFDPGFTQKFTGVLRRTINKDGSFNVRRRGSHWRDIHPYLHLINMRWPAFLGLIFLAYLLVNTVFAAIYFSLGPGALQGADAVTNPGRFLNSFFFSAHTLTTVGYGSLAPRGTAANFVAAFEAMVGLMGFAVATGLLFGRISRPSARIGFSDSILVTPYQNGTSLQFRIVNLRPNMLMEIEAIVLLMTVEGPSDGLKRSYKRLALERERVHFLPLTWTVVHPIDESSPLQGLTPTALKTLQAEFLILIKGYDDTFSQTVHSRFSYRYDEIVWGGRFIAAFDIDTAGDAVLDVDRVSAFEHVDSIPVLGSALRKEMS
jgi:inward rectifier potassium channel